MAKTWDLKKFGSRIALIGDEGGLNQKIVPLTLKGDAGSKPGAELFADLALLLTTQEPQAVPKGWDWAMKTLRSIWKPSSIIKCR
jgi:hypothetical protein